MNKEYITVGVLAYNSEKTIVRTLDSIAEQTYPYLDLIVNNDGSKDNTKSVVSKWVEGKRERFRRVILSGGEKNEGINKSFDSVMKQSKTKWTKFFAGDDIMLPNCLAENIDYVNKNNVDTIVYSRVIPFKEIDGRIVLGKCDTDEVLYAKRIANMSADRQYRHILMRDILFSPTGFINTDLYKQIGGIDTGIRNIEDWPLRLLLTSNGYRLYFMNKETVLYRTEESVSRTNGCLYNTGHIHQVNLVKRRLVYPNISWTHLLYYSGEIVESVRYFIVIRIMNNRDSILTIIVNSILKALELRSLPSRLEKTIFRLLEEREF